MISTLYATHASTPTMTQTGSALICDLSADLGLIEVSGEDALTFLQGQLTSDLGELSSERAQWSGHCTPKGRLLFTFLVWSRGASFVLQTPRVLREAAQKRIGMYVLRSKVKLTDVSDRFVRFGVAGVEAAGTLRALGLPVPQEALRLAGDDTTTVIALPEKRFELLAPVERAPALKVNSDAQAWQRLDIAAGIPSIGAATQDQFVPQMVNLDLIGGVSFSKGCYTGQEIVARTHYLGKVKRRMYRLLAPVGASPQAGDELFAATLLDQPAGMVVSAARGEDGAVELLAVVQVEFAKPSELRWKSADGPALSLLPLPYVV